MKTCAYCDRENMDEAIRCGECGTDEFRTSDPVNSEQRVPSYVARLLAAEASGSQNNKLAGRCAALILEQTIIPEH